MVNERFDNIWNAIAQTPVEAENLRIRSELMRQLIGIIVDRSWENAEAANHCGITLPRFDELMTGRIAKFSIEALISIAAALKIKVHIQLQSSPSQDT